MRTPSFSCWMVPKSWFAATLFACTKGELWALIWVRLEYLRLQNSGQPLQGWVFVGRGSVDVEDAVSEAVTVPFMLEGMESVEEDFGCPVRMRRGFEVVVDSVSVSLSEPEM